ncbi:MAG: sensor domain-containing diguanylate cyclase, partial [Candidatus Omnitrophica bacterium]|nr:sensor domain-containing diguanylate cyclase [Candidatus Omnitrophota bacterium]
KQDRERPFEGDKISALTLAIKYVIFRLMDELNILKEKTERGKFEFNILYEISNAMATTLKLDEILYIILTAATAHTALGFNRACLFLVNEEETMIEGKMAIGPKTRKEVSRIWTQIEQNKMSFEDLINAYQTSKKSLESILSKHVRELKVPIQEKEDSLLSLVALEGMPLHLSKKTIRKYKNTKVVQLLKSDEMVLIPLKAKDKTNGIIVADNFITKTPITKDNLRMLSLLANQAGLAIENSRLYQKTVIRTRMNSLTGLWNHGYFQHLLHREIDKAKKEKLMLSLIILDIDDFKIYNDKLGHQAGDKILKNLGHLLRNHFRKMDHVCRYGGEEFSIILPQTDKPEALLIAERLRKNIAEWKFSKAEILPKKRLTASLGLSTFPADADNPADLISAADKKLYQAKHSGKNKTCS